ncbi:MAG: T9SS type A sorting domain-containing protein [Ignavibacteria bacterium]|nr:T9SS type A sorting domain-containing protein [Ignavibacteria bacterium]
MKTTAIAICLLLFTVYGSHSQWVWQNPLPQGSTLNDVQFPNSNTGYAGGSQGRLLKTTNSGANWSLIYTGYPADINALYFFDANTGFICSGGELLKTLNGGSSWQLTYTFPEAGNTALDLIFLDQNTGFATLANGKIMKTINGGLTWSQYNTPYDLYNIAFANSNTGVAAGDWGAVMRTTNGGISWVYQQVGGDIPLKSVWFTDNNTGFITGTSGILRKTTNAGLNWNITIPLSTTVELNAIRFLNPSTGIITGGSGVVLKTTDAGDTWIVNYTANYNKLNSAVFADANTVFAVGDAGTIVKSTNTGTSWNLSSIGPTNTLNAIKFVDPNTGFAVGDSGTVMKTTNGGSLWQKQTISLTSKYSSIYFLDQNTGVAVGLNVIRTTNAGTTWSTTTAGTNWLVGVQFVDQNTGYAVGYANAFQKSTNGGVSWFAINPLINVSYSSLYFVNPNTGYVVGINGLLAKTTNAAANWSTINLGINTNLNCVYFTGPTSGYICGDNGQIHKTTNGGNSWISQNVTASIGLLSMVFVNDNTGFVSGRTGLVFKTTNAGNSWTPENTGASGDLRSMCSDPAGGIYAAGVSGNILKTFQFQTHTVAGFVRFSDNSQPVTAGRVQAVKIDPFTQQRIVVDSAVIQPNGSYLLPNVPQDSIDIMAFQDDEDNAAYVPTYYSSTIFWQSSNTLYPTGNLSDININVFRNSLSNENFTVSGNVSSMSAAASSLVKAIVYFKQGNVFRGYGFTNNAGNYMANRLAPGSYEVIADCMGHNGQTANCVITNSNISNFNFVLQSVIAVDPPGTEIPAAFTLGQNYPNPFNPVTTITYSLPRTAFVKLTVYDVLGRQVESLVNEQKFAGTYDARWNAERYSSGIYFYSVEAGDFREVKKMVLLK